MFGCGKFVCTCIHKKVGSNDFFFFFHNYSKRILAILIIVIKQMLAIVLGSPL